MYQIKKKSKKQIFHGDLAHSLIQLAVMEIEARGSIDFSLRDLSKKLGVSHAATYKHFKSKNDLLESIALQGYLKLSAAFQRSLNQPKKELESLGACYIEFALQNSGYYRVMFGVKLDHEQNKILHAASIETFFILLDTIGKRNTLNVKKAMFVWSVVHGWVMLRLEGQLSGLLDKFKTSENEVEEFLKQAASNI